MRFLASRKAGLILVVLAVLLGGRMASGAQGVAAAGTSPVLGQTSITAIALLDIIVVTALILRGFDVRLLLLLGALPLFALTGRLPAMLGTIAREMANPATVVPICSAIGFAFVLRLTECDQHLVALVLRPLRRFRALLIPGGIVAGYLINTTIVSQAGTAAVLGPLLVPLLRRRARTGKRGAILLLGSSMGGELFNPGAVEMRKLAELTGLSGSAVVARSARWNLLGSAAALAAFWLLARRRLRQQSEPIPPPGGPTEGPGDSPLLHVNLVKALVPVLPILLLALDASIGPNVVTRSLVGPARILAAMLIGVVVAGLSGLEKARVELGVLRGCRLRVHARHLAHRGGFDLCRGGSEERAGRSLDPGADSLAGRRTRGRDGVLLVPGLRLGNRDCSGGRDHGVLRSRGGFAGHRPGPAGSAHSHRRALRPHHEPGGGRGDDLGPAVGSERLGSDQARRPPAARRRRTPARGRALRARVNDSRAFPSAGDPAPAQWPLGTLTVLAGSPAAVQTARSSRAWVIPGAG